MGSHSGPIRIAHDVVAKGDMSGLYGGESCELEMRAANFVREHTTILTPRWQRLVKFTDGVDDRTIILRRYIPGRTLAQCWSTLGFWMQFRIALTMRFYIRQLRSLTSSVPGPLGVKPQKCWGHHFIEGGEGPFSTYAELSEYYAARLESTRRRAEAMKKPPPDLTPFDNSTPLVMTHHGIFFNHPSVSYDLCYLDLNERNIILGDDNQLWIIDWQHAGYYPEWFEYSALMIWFGQYFPDEGRPDLRRFVNLMAGRYEKPGQRPFYQTIYPILMLGIR